MEIITRSEARDRGLKRYFTGKPCKYGHISEYITDRGYCLECRRATFRRRYVEKNTIKNCRVCGIDFMLLANNQQFCSKNCFMIHRFEYNRSLRAKNTQIAHVQCVMCCAPFKSTNGRQSCSEKCRALMRSMSRRRICTECNKEFFANAPGQKTCCVLCSETRQRKREHAQRIHLAALREQGVDTGVLP